MIENRKEMKGERERKREQKQNSLRVPPKNQFCQGYVWWID